MKTLETRARDSYFCLGCDKPKQVGLVTCWHCFKYCKDIAPLKYFNGSFDKWVDEEVSKR